MEKVEGVKRVLLHRRGTREEERTGQRTLVSHHVFGTEYGTHVWYVVYLPSFCKMKRTDKMCSLRVEGQRLETIKIETRETETSTSPTLNSE